MTERNEKKHDGLTDEQLDEVSAGITVTKTADASSPTLFHLCCTGKHIGSGTTHS